MIVTTERFDVNENGGEKCKECVAVRADRSAWAHLRFALEFAHPCIIKTYATEWTEWTDMDKKKVFGIWC